MSTRTRFAPSPTGYMHVGNLRTALYEYLTAKHDGGSFILRIEDTDQGRYVEGAVDVIYKTLKDNGMNWDEGPDIGGDYGPYVQSERMGMFRAAPTIASAPRKGSMLCTKSRRPQAKLSGIMTENAAASPARRYRKILMPVCLMLSDRKCLQKGSQPSTIWSTGISR